MRIIDGEPGADGRARSREHQPNAAARPASLTSGSTYVVRTPCHQRSLQVREDELTGQERKVTAACPHCGQIWVLCIRPPLVLWVQ